MTAQFTWPNICDAMEKVKQCEIVYSLKIYNNGKYFVDSAVTMWKCVFKWFLIIWSLKDLGVQDVWFFMNQTITTKHFFQSSGSFYTNILISSSMCRLSLKVFLRYCVDENRTDVRLQWAFPLTLGHHNLISQSLSPSGCLSQIRRNSLMVYLRCGVHRAGMGVWLDGPSTNAMSPATSVTRSPGFTHSMVAVYKVTKGSSKTHQHLRDSVTFREVTACCNSEATNRDMV